MTPDAAPEPSAAPRPRLAGLLVGQFTTSFNDSAYKLLVALLAAATSARALTAASREAETERQITIAFVTFTVPLLLLSLPAGALADRVSKRSMLLALKAGEVALMLAAAAALWIAPGDTLTPLVVLGLMGVLAALFSPAKYGIVPQIVPHQGLTAANANLEMWTFLALIAGTAAAGPLREKTASAAWIAPLVLAACAAVGWLGCRAIPRVAPAGAKESVVASTAGAWKAIRADRVLWLNVLGQGFFWGVASLLGQAVLVYDKVVLDASDTNAVVPLAVFGIGVGVGALLASRLSGHKVEFGLIPLGALGMGVFTALFGVVAPGTIAGTSVFMALLGVSSGLLVVPFESILQWRAPAARRGGVVALANVFVFGGVLAWKSRHLTRPTGRSSIS